MADKQEAAKMEKPIPPDTAHIEKAFDSDEHVIDPQLDKRLNRKFDVHILPWLFGIW